MSAGPESTSVAPSLRRRTDRIEDTTGWLLMVVALVVLVVAIAAGLGTYTQRAQQRPDDGTHIPTTATLVHDAPPYVGPMQGVPPVVPVGARWTAPDGTPHSGVVPVGSGSPAGTTVPIWVDADGRLAPMPVGGAGAAGAGLSVTGALLALGWTLLLVLWLGVRAATNRYNLRQWEREWRVRADLWR